MDRDKVVAKVLENEDIKADYEMGFITDIGILGILSAANYFEIVEAANMLLDSKITHWREIAVISSNEFTNLANAINKAGDPHV